MPTPPVWHALKRLFGANEPTFAHDVSAPEKTPGLGGRPNLYYVAVAGQRWLMRNRNYVYRWVGAKCGYGPGSVWDMAAQRRCFTRLLGSVLSSPGRAVATYCVLQTQRCPIERRLGAAVFSQAGREVTSLGSVADAGDVRIERFGVGLNLEGAVFISPPPEVRRYGLASASVHRRLADGREGNEFWVALTDPRTGLKLLAAGTSPGTRPFARDLLNPCPIFTLVLCDAEGRLTRMAVQLAPDDGSLVDVRVASQHMSMSLGMDAVEERLLRSAAGLPPNPDAGRPADADAASEATRMCLAFTALDVRYGAGDTAIVNQVQTFLAFMDAGCSLRKAAGTLTDRGLEFDLGSGRAVGARLDALGELLGGKLRAKDESSRRDAVVPTDLALRLHAFLKARKY